MLSDRVELSSAEARVEEIKVWTLQFRIIQEIQWQSDVWVGSDPIKRILLCGSDPGPAT